MNHRQSLTAILCLGAAAALCLAAGESIPVRNAGFELDANHDKIPDDWERFDTRHADPKACANDRIDASQAHYGKFSARIDNRRTYLKSTGGTGWLQRAAAKNSGKNEYTVSVYVKASKPDTQVGIALFGTIPGWGDEYAGAVSHVFCVGQEWTRISHTNSFDEDVTSINILLFRWPQIEGGAVWFDDVELVRHSFGTK